MKISRARVFFQCVLHALLIGHVLAYYLLDWTAVGGLDFQDFFHNLLGEGVITAAVLFAGTVYLLSLIWGRLFCSWGCHFGATQDFAAWVLRKLGWRAPLVRTRFLHWTPYLLLVGLFLWPSVARWLDGGWEFRGAGRGGVLGGAGPWERLPGVFLSVTTFVVCGAGVLLFLGTRGFCRFVCPYGAVFRLTDRVTPFRVRRTGACATSCNDAESPAPCTRVCPTAIDVHAETDQLGKVRSVDCVRCHLCIEACPSQALSYGTKRWPSQSPVSIERVDSFAGAARDRVDTVGVSSSERNEASGRSGRSMTPEIVTASTKSSGEVASAQPSRPSRTGPITRESRFALRFSEELLVFVSATATFLICDLVYGGHFLAATLAVGEGFLVLLLSRLVRRREVRILGCTLRKTDRWSFAGITLFALGIATLAPIYHAASYKTHRLLGMKVFALERETQEDVRTLELRSREEGELDNAADHLRVALERFPSDLETRRALCLLYVERGDTRAIGEAETIARLSGESRQALSDLRDVYFRFGRTEEATWIDRRLAEE